METFHSTKKVCSLVSIDIHPSISLPPNFLTFNTCLCILGALMGYIPFVESFVAKVFEKYFNIIVSAFILVDP
jgi:hypothetical protein